jgi:hypothetical protein
VIFAVAGITFDGTVSLGSLVAAGSVVVAVLGAAWRNGLVMKVGLLKIGQIEERLAHVEIKVDGFSLMQQKLMDGKEKMDDHEARLRLLEKPR